MFANRQQNIQPSMQQLVPKRPVQQQPYYEQEQEPETDKEQLKMICKQWFAVDKQIEGLNQQLKSLRNKRTELQKHIIQFMQQNKIEELKTPEDNIELQTSNQERYISSKMMLEMMNQFANEKNIPILRNFLSNMPVKKTNTRQQVKRIASVSFQNL